jgi:hypothetical protein
LYKTTRVARALIAALQEKDEEDHGEESASITLARSLKNSKKIKKIVKRCSVRERNKMAPYVGCRASCLASSRTPGIW